MSSVFKVCPCCNNEWVDQESFISDREIELIGYKADFEKLDFSMFFFNHKKRGCDSTITIQALEFLNLYKGTRYTERKTGTEGCPRYCLTIDQLQRCDAFCECAFNREIINVIKERKK